MRLIYSFVFVSLISLFFTACSSSTEEELEPVHLEPNFNYQAGEYFPNGALWYGDYSQTPTHPYSSYMIKAIQSAGGWGGGRLRIDFSLEVLEADQHSTLTAFIPSDDHYTPDCDIAEIPLPANGVLEGEDSYQCTKDGDCHLIIVDRTAQKFYEMWRAHSDGSDFYGGCLAIWDMTKVYDHFGRGEQCTSADAAGFPIAPLVFTADEVAAGEINHAIRFVLPNDRIQEAMMVAPATHGNKATSGGSKAPPFGVHLRLKANVDISKLSKGAQVVAKALKKYGMFHADGGQITLTAQSDRYSQHKWNDLLGPEDLASLKVSDFEVVGHGPTREVTYDCQR